MEAQKMVAKIPKSKALKYRHKNPHTQYTHAFIHAYLLKKAKNEKYPPTF
ncbi:hypothetical protein [Helicobacter macacae]|uniref:Uncharacterized protein n=1 Tax=Helicobacter macacae MIT 99-5501 TaxID=1357400 RepID=V8C9S5_9HELI|nr:hypothetical protein [Helicobacter macacae]ETD23461.1 hypothetical protein HMPREF2086_01266 [Helicobacter macacae MIT 99-5501]